ncbi:Disease resistance protein RPM1 [Glycine max]|nr:Disease resistance protein RPM1 [Glycine max]
MEKNHHLISGVTLTKILGFGYDDLPYHLKFCLFKIDKIDSIVDNGRICKNEEGQTIEEVAQQYLTELIVRSLVNEDESMSSGMIQHLSIAITSNDLMESIESSCTWSLFVFSLEESTISNNYVLRIPTKYRLLKVLDFEDGELSFVPGNCGNLAHLRYFSIRNIWRASFPKLLISSLLEKQHSTTRRQHRLFGDCCRIYARFHFSSFFRTEVPIAHYCTICSNSGDASEGASNMALGKSNPPDIDEDLHSRQLAWLQNLETLDIRNTMVTKMPKEICKHRKLRHLLGDEMTLFQLKNSLRGMTSLQTLHQVSLVILDEYGEKINKDGDVIKLIRELRKLKQLRNLGVMDVKEEQGSTLCSSINEIQNLEKLNIVDDPLKSLQNMSQLLFLAIGSMSYEGKNLYFQDGGIQQLKELRLKYLYNLDSIVIYKGALHSLRKLQFREIPQLNTVPLGIQHLKKLEV